MILTLPLLGIFAGLTSGFFGIGGGLVLVPLLLIYGFDMKSAISISIMQMVFSSVYGSFLNIKKNKDIINDGLSIGIGGFLGGAFSGIIVANIDALYLKYLFLFILLFSIYRLYFTPLVHTQEQTSHNKFLLIFIGFVIGMFAMSIGIGGSVLLTPILASYMYYNLKDASSLSLFFIVFSSIAGFISLSINSQMLYEEGIIVAVGSLIGVYVGIKLKHIIKITSYKKLTLGLYGIILVLFLYKF